MLWKNTAIFISAQLLQVCINNIGLLAYKFEVGEVTRLVGQINDPIEKNYMDWINILNIIISKNY